MIVAHLTKIGPRYVELLDVPKHLRTPVAWLTCAECGERLDDSKHEHPNLVAFHRPSHPFQG